RNVRAAQAGNESGDAPLFVASSDEAGFARKISGVVRERLELESEGARVAFIQEQEFQHAGKLQAGEISPAIRDDAGGNFENRSRTMEARRRTRLRSSRTPPGRPALEISTRISASSSFRATRSLKCLGNKSTPAST